MVSRYTGELDEAANWYERVIDERDPFALVYAASPQLASLRAHWRWPAIARMMHLPTTSDRVNGKAKGGARHLGVAT